MDGDAQADPTAHGGIEKAVYWYPAEHYAAWSAELGRALGYGTFGENLTVEGFVETDVRLGDAIRVGGALLAVTRPRLPCFKLAAHMGDPGF